MPTSDRAHAVSFAHDDRRSPMLGEPMPGIMLSRMRAAILTVSTSVAVGETEDRSGEALAQHARAAGAEIVAQDVLGDRGPI
jgi:molybdopterin biosynthesis enzyme MoaB